MKRICLLSFILVTSICLSYAQVETRFFLNGDAGKHVRQSKQAKTVISMPSFDLAAMQKEDAERDKRPCLFRFGKGFDVSYTLADGQWENVEGGRLWTMTFESKDALSLNFVFNDFYLPEGAEFYILNKDETVLYGPVTMEATTKNGVFLTDLIEGSQATLYLYEPSESTGQSSLSIKRVVHGYRGEICKKDTEEAVGLYNRKSGNNRTLSDYEDEADAIARVIYPTGDYYFSGALVMSNDFSFKSYYLTSFYFPDVDSNGSISNSEIAEAENSLFSFPCTTGPSATSYSYNQADFRSAWITTGFSLFEIRGNLKQNPNLAWLCWNSSTATPSSGVMLRATYSSISAINSDNPIVDEGNNWDVHFGGIGDIHYQSSYGAPLLDQNKKLVGVFNYPLTYWKGRFGKFSVSLLGGMTNTTGLGMWLDPSCHAFTKSCYRSFIIAGPSTIISSSSYSVLNLPDDMSVTWSVSNIYYNQNCLQQNYPSSNQCTITRDNSHSMSGATLTATIKRDNVPICAIEKIINTGNGFDGTYFNGITTKQIDLPVPLFVLPETIVTINSLDLIGATVSQYGGNGTPTSWAFNSTSGILQVGMPSSIDITVVVKVVTSGGTIYYLPIITKASDYELMYAMQNGSSIDVRALPLQTSPSQDKSSSSTDLVWQVEVYNVMTGEIAYSGKVVGVLKQIDTTGWKSGVYIIRANIGKKTYSKKVIVK